MRKDLPRGRASGAASAGQMTDLGPKHARERPSLALVDARARATHGCEGSPTAWPACSAAIESSEPARASEQEGRAHDPAAVGSGT